MSYNRGPRIRDYKGDSEPRDFEDKRRKYTPFDFNYPSPESRRAPAQLQSNISVTYKITWKAFENYKDSFVAPEPQTIWNACNFALKRVLREDEAWVEKHQPLYSEHGFRAEVGNVRKMKDKAFIDLEFQAGSYISTPSPTARYLASCKQALWEVIAWSHTISEDGTELVPPAKAPKNPWAQVWIELDLPSERDANTVFIGKLYDASESQLFDLFKNENFNPLSINIPTHADGSSKQVAYAVFRNRDIAKEAAAALNGKPVAKSYGIKTDIFIPDEQLDAIKLFERKGRRQENAEFKQMKDKRRRHKRNDEDSE